MPAILAPEHWPLWLDPAVTDAALVGDLLRPAADDLLTLAPVSRLLNDVNNEGAELLLAEPEAEADPAPVELTLFG